MILEHTKEFDKSIRKIKDKIALIRLDKLLDEIEKAQHLSEISNIIPLTNHPTLYRITRGDYRLIIKYLKRIITVILIDYRKRDEKTYKGLN